jgi:hypothetical protein
MHCLDGNRSYRGRRLCNDCETAVCAVLARRRERLQPRRARAPAVAATPRSVSVHAVCDAIAVRSRSNCEAPYKPVGFGRSDGENPTAMSSLSMTICQRGVAIVGNGTTCVTYVRNFLGSCCG